MHAQQGGLNPGTLSVEVDRVNVLFTVYDGKGRLVRNLNKGDFSVYEDERPQNISTIRRFAQI